MTTAETNGFLPSVEQNPFEDQKKFPALLSFPVFYRWVSTIDPDIDVSVLWKTYDHALNKLLKLFIQSQLHLSGNALN